MVSELDAQIQQLNKNEDDNNLEADVEGAADVFMAVEKAVRWCQVKVKELHPPSTSGAAAPSSGSLTTKLPKQTYS